MNSASCCLGVRISSEHWPTSNLQDLQERVPYFEEGKAGKYGRGDGKDEEEMKDQLALLRKLAKGIVWCSVYTCVHAGVLTPYVRRLLCVYAARFGDLLLFYFHCHHYSSTFFAFSFHGGKWGDSGWL